MVKLFPFAPFAPSYVSCNTQPSKILSTNTWALLGPSASKTSQSPSQKSTCRLTGARQAAFSTVLSSADEHGMPRHSASSNDVTPCSAIRIYKTRIAELIASDVFGPAIPARVMVDMDVESMGPLAKRAKPHACRPGSEDLLARAL